MLVEGKEVDLKQFAEMCAAIGARIALEKLESEKQETLKERFDRRLRNTELLLKNYNNFSVHRNKSIYSSTKAIDILCEIDTHDNDISVESIKNSVDRTSIILAHIDKILETYKYICDKKPEAKRRYQIITGLFIEEDSPEDLCEKLSVYQSTFYRDKKLAIQELRTLLFGIDGIKMK